MVFETESARSQFVQRVVRTDFYINLEAFPAQARPVLTPGLSAVWLHDRSVSSAFGREYHVVVDGSDRQSPEDRTTDALAYLSVLVQQRPVAADRMRQLVEQVRAMPAALRETVFSHILQESIILERSPPVSEKLSNLIHGASSVSLGWVVGTNLTHDPYMMLITIPAGIILMGSAIGISRGLERGLSKRIEKAVNPPKRRKKS